MPYKGRVLYVGGFELPDKNAAAIRVISNGKIMRDLGFDVVFLGVKRSEYASTTGLQRDDDFEGFECWYVPLPKSGKGWLSYAIGAREILDFVSRENPSNISAIITYNYPAIAQLRLGGLAKKKKARMIADITEWYEPDASNLLVKTLRWCDIAMRMYYANAKADGLFTTSVYLTDFYRSRNKKVAEFPTLFDTAKFAPPPPRGAKERPKFIYVGTPFDPGRVNRSRTNLKERLDRVVTAFLRLANEGYQFQFDIYGITKSQYLEVFAEHEGPLCEFDDKIRFHGRQPHNTVIDQLAKSDASVFCRDETRVTLAGFPTKLAESISCGTPVITNRMRSVERYENNSAIILAKVGEESDAIFKVLQDDPCNIMNLKRLAYESRQFDYRKFRPEMKKIFEETGQDLDKSGREPLSDCKGID